MIYDAGRAAAHNPQAAASLKAHFETGAEKQRLNLDSQELGAWMLG